MRLSVLPGERFSCGSCTNCCRDWFVELMPGEAERIESLRWPAGQGPGANPVVVRRQGRAYVGHRAGGDCTFLDSGSGRCMIHEKFGPSAKPLGCRLFPHQIEPTFVGQASVSLRMDCPTVRKSRGEEMADGLPQLRRLAAEIGVNGATGFDELIRCLLDEEQISAVVDLATTMFAAFPRDDQRAIFLHRLCEWLHGTDVRELSRESLMGAFPGIKENVESLASAPVAAPGWIHRLAFRALLGLYLRRDEDVLNGLAGRLPRAAALGAVALGFGSIRSLGRHHPAGRVRRAKLFTHRPLEDTETTALIWRVVRAKLSSFQFMGRANLGLNFLSGLRSLALFYPLSMAAARCSAAGRGSESVESGDIEFGVAAIEHSFGRLPALGQPVSRSLHEQLLEPAVFVALARTV